jgi:hypothetical protein
MDIILSTFITSSTHESFTQGAPRYKACKLFTSYTTSSSTRPSIYVYHLFLWLIAYTHLCQYHATKFSHQIYIKDQSFNNCFLSTKWIYPSIVLFAKEYYHAVTLVSILKFHLKMLLKKILAQRAGYHL